MYNPIWYVIQVKLQVIYTNDFYPQTAGRKVSVVIVDRSLDLVMPTSHQEHTLMDRILTLLPRLPGHKIDSAINMSPMCSLHP